MSQSITHLNHTITSLNQSTKSHHGGKRHVEPHVRIFLLATYVPIFLFSIVGLLILARYLKKKPCAVSPFLNVVVMVMFVGVLVGM